MITGDFNFPHIDWSHWSSPEWDIAGNPFLETVDDLFLFQHMLTPTRQRQDQVPSTLDLVLSDDEHSVNKLLITDSLGKSDHFMVEFEYVCYAVTVENHIPRYLYDFGDYQRIVTKLLEIDWSQIFDTLSVDDGWMYFHKVLVPLVDEYVPTSSTCTRKHSEWMTKPVLRKIRLKRKEWMKYKITQSDSDYLAYIKCRNEATKAVKESKHCYEKELAEGISINSKRFWRYVNSKIKVKSSLSELQRLDGSLTNCDGKMANILNDYFATVFVTEDTTKMPSLGDVCSGKLPRRDYNL